MLLQVQSSLVTHKGITHGGFVKAVQDFEPCKITPTQDLFPKVLGFAGRCSRTLYCIYYMMQRHRASLGLTKFFCSNPAHKPASKCRRT